MICIHIVYYYLSDVRYPDGFRKTDKHAEFYIIKDSYMYIYTSLYFLVGELD